jgi:hypothetical protein
LGSFTIYAGRRSGRTGSAQRTYDRLPKANNAVWRA